MQLSRKILPQLATAPPEQVWSMPEKVLQFGTGVLLRGLPDYFIDKANREGIFNGRIVVVKSTANGGTDAFRQQDGLFTLLERGVRDGERVDQVIINSAISRVLSASDEWQDILACAANPGMQVVISNTTEIGIVLVEEDVVNTVPVSFPGRLLAFLEERYRAFGGSEEAGMVIVPTELIVDNGTKLKTIVTTLAQRKGLDERFLSWLTDANDFCNSLVDCIVPGKLSGEAHAAMERQLGYSDELMIMSEPYRLWAIETNRQRTREILSFSEANPGMILTPDINKFRELKLRLLNATHTFSCALAYLSGFNTVKEAMADEQFPAFVSSLMRQEIAPLIVDATITKDEAETFAAQVLDRFRNPYIEHQWLSISAQYTSKMAMRCVPLIEKQYQVQGEVPSLMALGFAAYLLFSKPVEKDNGQFFGSAAGRKYALQDDKAAALYEHWQTAESVGNAIRAILSDKGLYGTDLTRYAGFAEAVQSYFTEIVSRGAAHAIQSGALKQTIA